MIRFLSTQKARATSASWPAVIVTATEDKEKSYALALNFYKKFEKEFSSAICYDLIECDLTTSHGQKVFKESNLFEKKNASDT